MRKLMRAHTATLKKKKKKKTNHISVVFGNTTIYRDFTIFRRVWRTIVSVSFFFFVS